MDPLGLAVPDEAYTHTDWSIFGGGRSLTKTRTPCFLADTFLRARVASCMKMDGPLDSGS